ncbi:unnamed protein product [Calypogeia fissa]
MAVGVVGAVIPRLSAVACNNSSSSDQFRLQHQRCQVGTHNPLSISSLHSIFLQSPAATPNRQIGRRQLHSDAGGGDVAARGMGNGRPSRGKNPMDDMFDYGEDEDMEYGELMSTGKQSVELPKPPKDLDNEQGYLDFPEFYNVEIASLGLYVRNDVRRCLVWVAGGVYENILFFPAIQLLRNRYPGVKIDVVSGERGKQAYEMNKYINRTIVFDTDADWTVPGELVEFLGMLRGEYYDFILSTQLAGFKHCATLFMVGGRTRRVGYVHKYHSEWVSTRFLTEYFVAPSENLAELGYNMYEELMDYVARPARGVPREEIPSLQIGVPKRVRTVVQEKMNEAGLTEGKYVVFHGIESDSAATMTSRGDTDSLLPLQFWGQLKQKLQEASGMKVVVVIPHKKERPKVFEACGQDTSVIFITTPGQLASLVRDSAGVVSTNTAAMLMAVAFNKPSVALFGSPEKAARFVPPQAEKIKAIASKTGKLAGVDVDDAASAWRTVFEGQLVLTA